MLLVSNKLQVELTRLFPRMVTKVNWDEDTNEYIIHVFDAGRVYSLFAIKRFCNKYLLINQEVGPQPFVIIDQSAAEPIARDEEA